MYKKITVYGQSNNTALDENFNFLQRYTDDISMKILEMQDNIIKECISKHYKLPITEQVGRRLTCVTHQDSPGERWYYLDGYKFICWFGPLNSEIKQDESGRSTYIHSHFNFQTEYKESEFIKKPTS